MSDRPKALRYGDALVAVEQRIVGALPEIVEGLIAGAKGGDTKAAIYLLDRIMGRAAGAKAAPADDREIPYGEGSFRIDRAASDSRQIVRRIVIPDSDERYPDA